MVNWQENYYYKGVLDYQAKTGLSLAERNYLQNPNGNQSPWWIFGVSLFTGLFNTGLDYATEKINGSQDTGSATDVSGGINLLKDFNATKVKYDEAVSKGNQSNILKYAQELKKIGEEGKDDPTIKRIYKGDFRTKIENTAKPKQV